MIENPTTNEERTAGGRSRHYIHTERAGLPTLINTPETSLGKDFVKLLAFPYKVA